MRYKPERIARVIDHTLLRADAVLQEVHRLCEEAVRYGFHSVCVNPSFVADAKECLRGNTVRVCTVVGFPLGATLPEVKVYEAIEAALLGADELDIVMNIGMAKRGSWEELEREIRSVVMATPDRVHKIILETGCLTDEEIKRASAAAAEAGAEFIKTSTGFGPRGATVRDVELIREAVSGRAAVKAAGGIRSLDELLTFLRAGAERIGTTSGVRIMEEALSVL